MYINQIFELSMTLDNKRFQKIFKRKHKKSIYAKMDEEEYIDESMTSKGITVIYRDSQYKKKIKLIIDPGLVSESRSSDKLIRKLDKCINPELFTAVQTHIKSAVVTITTTPDTSLCRKIA